MKRRWASHHSFSWYSVHFIIFFCVCLCRHIPACVHEHVHMSMCGGQRSMMRVFLSHCPLYLWDSISHCMWSATIQLDLLTNKSQGSSLSCLVSAGITGTHCCACLAFLYISAENPNSGPHSCMASTLPSPHPHLCMWGVGWGWVLLCCFQSTRLVCLPGCGAIGTNIHQMSLAESDPARVELRDLCSNPTWPWASDFSLSIHYIVCGWKMVEERWKQSKQKQSLFSKW